MTQRNDDAVSTRDLAAPTETTASAVSGPELDAPSRKARPSSQAPVRDDQPGAPVQDDQPGALVIDRSLDRSASDDPAGAQDVASPERSETAVASPPSSGGAPAPDADVQADVSEPLLAAEESADFQLRWEQVQTRFVDEPRGAVEDADELVANLMQQLAAGFAQERDRLEAQWGRGEDISTEDLRVALKRYRSFFQRLLST